MLENDLAIKQKLRENNSDDSVEDSSEQEFDDVNEINKLRLP